MIGLDTSIVVRLLIGEPADQAELAAKHLSTLRASGILAAVSDLVVGESYFALRHHYGVPHAEAVGALSELLGDPGIGATGVSRDVLAESRQGAGEPGLMDRLIHADYDRGGASMVTFDQRAGRLDGAEVLES